jgi:iron complex transport system substrate-binding protein
MFWGSARWALQHMRGCELSSRKRAGCLWRLCALTIVLASTSSVAAQNSCERIVSLAPSVTELVFELGLGGRLVGATEFCRYPSEALAVPRIGGYLDVSIERIVTSRPTTVLSLRESEMQVRPLERFSMTVDLLNHSSLAGIKASYQAVAKRCGVEFKASELLASLAEREAAVRDRCAQSRGRGAPPRVMVVVGRTREGSADSGVYVSGNDGFYADIITLLGAANVHQGRTVAVPTLSAEGVLKLAPDVIIDVVNIDDKVDEGQVRKFWAKFPSLPAVKQGSVVIVSDDFASIPGPRYIQLAEKVAETVCGALATRLTTDVVDRGVDAS